MAGYEWRWAPASLVGVRVCASKASCVRGHWCLVKGRCASCFVGCSMSPSHHLGWRGRGFETGNFAVLTPGSSAGNTAHPQTHGSSERKTESNNAFLYWLYFWPSSVYGLVSAINYSFAEVPCLGKTCSFEIFELYPHRCYQLIHFICLWSHSPYGDWENKLSSTFPLPLVSQEHIKTQYDRSCFNKLLTRGAILEHVAQRLQSWISETWLVESRRVCRLIVIRMQTGLQMN